METTDAELVGRCRRGDHDAWEAIVRQHHTRVYRLAYQFTGRFDEAEDVTQEIFLKVYRTIGMYRSETGAFATWLLRVARNHLIDHYRKHRTERAHTEPLELAYDRTAGMASRTDNPAQALERRQTADRIHALLLELPPDQREVVILRDLEEMTYEEIAEVLDVPVGTVKSRINRGRIELARLIKARR